MRTCAYCGVSHDVMASLCVHACAICVPQIIPQRLLPQAAVARVIFFPLFAMCDVTDNKLPVLFRGIISPTLIMALMAVTNGYVSTLSMMYGPKRVGEDDAEAAGSIMVFALTLGLFTGSLVSYLVLLIVVGYV